MRHTDTKAIEAGNPAMDRVVCYIDLGYEQRYVVGLTKDGDYATWQIGYDGKSCNTGHYALATKADAVIDIMTRAQIL